MSGDTDGEDGLFTKDNLPTLVAFFLFVFSSGAFMSLITPFLPLVLTKCGADSVLIGLVFAAYPFANICAVPLSTKLCSVLGRSKAFVFGAALEALFGILFGYAHLFAGSSLKYFYLLIRFIQGECEGTPARLALRFSLTRLHLVHAGFGSSIAYTALIGWVSTRFRERLASVLGFQEAIGGVGLMLGPSLGGLLYGLAGISLPLVIFSVLVLVSIPPLFLSMGADEAPEASEPPEKVEPDAESIAEDLTVSDLVNVSTVNATVVTLIAAIGFGFINPVAAIHFRDVLSSEIKPGEIGLLLAIPALLYAVFSPISGILSESWGYKKTMYSGLVVVLAGYVLFGPLHIFRIDKGTWGMWVDQCFALVFLGIGAAFAFVPALPDMQRSVHHLGPEAINAIAGYFNGMYCLGEALGPLLAGLKDVLPFNYVLCVLYGIHGLYLLVGLYWYLTTKLCQVAIRR